MSFSSHEESSEYLERPDDTNQLSGADGQDPEFDFDPGTYPGYGDPVGMYMETGGIPLDPGTFDLGAAYNPMAGSGEPEGERDEGDNDNTYLDTTAEAMARDLIRSVGLDGSPEAAEVRMAELAGLLEEQEALGSHPTYEDNNPPAAADYDRVAAECIETRFPDESPEDRQAHVAGLAELLIENDLARQAVRGEVPILPDSAAEEISDEEIEWQNERAAEVIGIIAGVTNTDPLGNQFSVDKDGIFLPTKGDHILTVLRAVDPQPGEEMIDLGSGDGRWPMVAGAALGMDAYGYERSTGRHELAERARTALLDGGIEEAADVHLLHEDLFKADISNADVIVYYVGGGPSKKQVENKIMSEAKDGARVVFYGLFEQDYVSRMTETANSVPGVSMPTRIYRVDRQQPQQP